MFSRFTSFSLLLAAMFIPSFLLASNATWNGTVDATWAGANWSASPVPGTGDTATFNNAGNSRTTIDLGGGVTVSNILFDTASAAAYTLGSGGVGNQALTLNDTAQIWMNSAVANHQLVNANVVLGTAVAGTTTFTNGAAAKTLTFAGTIQGGTGGTAGAKTLNLNGSGTNILQGAINKGGSTAINVANVGTGNTFLGGAGTSALSTLRATANGTVTVDGQTVTVASSSIYGNSSSAYGKFILNSGSAAFNGGISSSTLSGAVAGSDNMAFIVNGGTFSASSVALGRSFSFSGTAGANTTTAQSMGTSGFQVNGGTATVSGAANLLGSNGGANGQVSGSGVLSIGGELVLGGSGNAGTTRTTLFQVTGGTLTNTDTAGGGIVLGKGSSTAASGELLLTGGTTTTEKISFGVNAGIAGSFGNLTLNGSGAVLYVGSGGIVLAANNAYTYSIGLMSGMLGAKANWTSALNMSLSGSGMIIKTADASDAAKDILLSGVLSGANGFTKIGAGTLTLSGSNMYTGGTVITNGTLKLSGGSLTNTAISCSGTATLAVQPGSTTTINAGDTAAGTAGASLNLGAQTFDMRDGFKSTFNLQQQASFATAGLTIANGATLKFDLVDAGADLLAVTKAAAVSGTVNVTLATNLLTTLTPGSSYNLITAASGLTSSSPTWQFTGGGTSQRITLGGSTYLLILVATDTAVSVQVASTYTVTYNGNGNTGGTAPTDGGNPYNPGATVTVLGNTGSLTNSGYTFDGWNTQADGLGAHFIVGGTFSIASNATLFAQWASTSSSITAPATFPAGLSTTYGTASGPQSVAVSGMGLTVDITATSTNSLLEISSDGSTYGATATIGQSGGSASGTLYVRLTTNAPVAGNFNSQNIILTSFGVPTVMVATTPSGNTVTAKALTVNSAVAQNKLYDGTVTAVITGTLNGVTNGDTVTLNLSGNFASSAVGGPYSVTSTSTLGGAGAGNYTLTQPTGLTASIFATTAWNNPAGGLWGTATNWLNNVIATGSGQTADFSQVDVTADATVNLDSARTIGHLVFGDTDTGTAASLTISNNATPANTLTLAGTTPTITVNPLGSGKSAGIAAVVAGSSGLTKAGSGTLILSAANNYTGGTVVSNGTLVWSADNNLGASASGITLQGGTLTMSATAGAAIVDTHTITVGAGGGTLHNANTANDLILGTAGLLTGSGSLTNTGNFGIWLQAANAGFTGNLYVNGGVTEAGVATALGSSAVTVNAGGELAVDSVTLANNVTVDGGTISGNNGSATVFSGSINIAAGGMTMANRYWWSPGTAANATLGGVVSGASLTKTGGGTLTLSVANTFTNLYASSGKVTFNHSSAGGNGIIYATNGVTILAGSGISSGALAAPITVSGISANVTLQNANASGGINSSISGTADQTLTIDSGGGQAVNLNTTNKQLQNFYGTVTVSSGATLAFRNTKLGDTGAENGSDNALFNVLGSISTRNNGFLALGALSGSGTLSIGTAGNSGAWLTYTIGARGTDATFTGVIKDGDVATGKLVEIKKTGAGTQTLSGTNTYSGYTAINQGTLALSGSGSISNTPHITIAGGATFDVSGLSSTFVLGTNQTLLNAASATGIICGNLNTGGGTNSFGYVSGTPVLTVTNGTLTLSASTTLKINNTGAALAVGNHKLISKATTGNVGAVAGTVPGTVVISGAGTAGPSALSIIDGELYLVVFETTLTLGSSSPIAGYLTPLTFTASVQTNGVTAGNAGGTVQFKTNGFNFGSAVAVAGGSAVSSSLNNLPRGTNLITAIYSGDATYPHITNTFLQVVTNHPPVVNAISYSREGSSVWHMPVSDLLTNAADVVDGDVLTLVSVGVSTNGATVLVAGGYVNYSNGNPVDDQFSYTVTDGYGGTNTATITLVYGGGGAVTGTSSMAGITGGDVKVLTAYGIPGETYITQRATNLEQVVWDDIATNTLTGANVVISVTDSNPPPGGAYYRLKWQQP